jgi:periplasmic divalent cation tolerance protein
MQTFVVVLTNLPDRDTALAMGRALVERRLAACASVLAGCTSVYRWQGAIETADEVPVLIKTRRELYAEVEQAIRSLHPYAVPEIVALPVQAGLPEYLGWIETETARGGAHAVGEG